MQDPSKRPTMRAVLRDPAFATQMNKFTPSFSDDKRRFRKIDGNQERWEYNAVDEKERRLAGEECAVPTFCKWLWGLVKRNERIAQQNLDSNKEPQQTFLSTHDHQSLRTGVP